MDDIRCSKVPYLRSGFMCEPMLGHKVLMGSEEHQFASLFYKTARKTCPSCARPNPQHLLCKIVNRYSPRH